MASQDFFQVPQSLRTNFIENGIVAKLPQEQRESAKERSARIATLYMAFDSHALSILGHAAEGGRFDYFAKKLETEYEKSVAHLTPGSRTVPDLPGTMETYVFFDRCYRELGIDAPARL